MGRRSRSGRSECGLCGIRVESKDEHLKYMHGWVDCAYCRNSMERSSLENHLQQKHNHQMLGLVASVTRALDSKKDEVAVAKNETKAKACCHCKAMVHSMAEHLEKKHGYIRCKVCNNLMPADSLDKHLGSSHGQNLIDNQTLDLGFKKDDKIQIQTHKVDVPFDEFLQPVTTKPPAVDLNNIYDLVSENNGSSFINAQLTFSMANDDGKYFNTILISDKELNKLMLAGRIGSQLGQLFLRDS